MGMGPIAIGFGGIFIAIGLFGYLTSETRSATALIPAGLGVAFVVLGVLARNDKLRMHVMHLAALLGLVGFVGGAVMAIRAATSPEGIQRPLAFGSQVAMAVASAVFVGLCVKSFVDARRARRAREQAEQQAPAAQRQ
jgi:membrane-bound ClpP family serine protease